MGMAASQLRLLALTSRLHDVELKAQNIMSQKLSLTTQKDKLYQDYCEALDKTKITVAFRGENGGSRYVDANYSTLCTYNQERKKQYALMDNSTGYIITSQEVKNTYEEFDNDKYAFAYAMLGFGYGFGWSNPAMGNEIGIGTAQDDYTYTGCGTSEDLYMTECEKLVFDEHPEDYDLYQKFDNIYMAENEQMKKQALEDFRTYLYDNYAGEIYKKMILDKQETPEFAEELDDRPWSDIRDEFNYYVRLWEMINEAGGCQVVSPEYESGDAGSEWFNNMVESAMISIYVWDETGSSKEWSETSVATSTNNNYLQEEQDDKDLKKAEAKYEHELDIINRKETKFDTELSKLETERSAITTEMESIETVKKDNIDRSFNIFS